MSKKVLFITRKWPPAVGGMETYARRLSEELAGLTDLTVLSLPGRADGRPPSGVALIWFGLRTGLTVLRMRTRYDAVHGGDLAVWPIVFLAGLRNGKARLVLSAHGSDVAYANRSGVKPFFYRLYLRLGAQLMKHARIAANSRATAALCAEHGLRNIAVIPLAADTPAQPHAVAPPKPYILFVGRLTEQKGCGWFIRHVLPVLPDHLHLNVAGTIIDDSERETLDHARVHYLGPVFGEGLARLRREAAAVIVPNIERVGGADFEGFGLAAVEGAADGGVVVASRFKGVVDAVRDVETGFLSPPGDKAAWTQKLAHILEWSPTERERFLTKAAAAVRKYYSWKRVATETAALYETDVLQHAPQQALDGDSTLAASPGSEHAA